MNQRETIEMFEHMADTWPHFGVKSEGMVKVWAEALEPYPCPAVVQALKQLALTTTFAPSIALIAHTVDIAGWTLERAIEEAKPWALYVEQRMYENGSGFAAAKPTNRLPVKVSALLRLANPAAAGWEERMRWAWKDALPK